MAKISNKQLEQLRFEQKRARRKLSGMKRYKEDVSLGTFGYDDKMLTSGVDLSPKEFRKQLNELKKFNTKANRLVNIGSSTQREYIASTKLDKLNEIMGEYNRFTRARQRAVKVATTYYNRLDENGQLVKVKREGMDKLAQTNEFMPVRLRFGSGKESYGEGMRKSKDVSYRDIVASSEELVDSIIARYEKRADVVGNERFKQLKDNYLKGVAASTSQYFADYLEDVMNRAQIDAIDFLYMFDATDIFTFSFIYDEQIAMTQKEDAILSEVQAFRVDPPAGYTEYRRIMEEYEKEV